ncbi:MAG: hypothetical protein HYX47_10640 [Burkholderiales bacterium]|nr:hypothetical protein [Burkholderiales bacterium]
MHSAPSVTYPVGRSRFMGLLAAGLWLGGAVAAGWWWAQSDAAGWRHGIALAVLAAAGAHAALAWWRSPQGDLAWDGSGWAWDGAGAAGSLHVALDLQRHMLVRWNGPGRSGWLWLERARSPARWQDLRRAVYSRARPDALPGAPQPAAKP